MASATADRALDARDVRRGGRWTRSQRVKNALIRAAVHVALGVADRLPAPLLSLVCRALGWTVWVVAPGLRRRAVEAVADALPDVDARGVARAACIEAGQSLATTLLLRRPAVRALDLVDVPADARALLATTLGEGAGAVFASAHLGAFEVVAAAIAELGHRPVAVVRESYDPALDRVVDRHRVARGVGVIHRGHPGAALGIVRALRRGSPVGFLPDLGSRVPGIPARFLGRTANAPIGPQRIATRAGAPILVGTLAPPADGGRRPRLVVERIPPDPDEGILTHRVTSALERRILAFPHGWLWLAQTRR